MKAKSSPTLDDFRTSSYRDQRAPCKIGLALEQLDPKLRPVFEEAIALLDSPASGVTAGGIIAKFVEYGVTIPLLGQTFTQHRHKRCLCFEARKNDTYVPALPK